MSYDQDMITISLRERMSGLDYLDLHKKLFVGILCKFGEDCITLKELIRQITFHRCELGGGVGVWEEKMMARAEIAESSFEYLLCEILALDPPNTQDIEQVSES
jgi:hypothetical protein